MDERELEMYKLQDMIEDLLSNVPKKQIVRIRKISKNTIKKYNKILLKILEDKPEIGSDINRIMDEFRRLRKEESYSENFGWLNSNDKIVETFASQCKNIVRLFEKLNENGFTGSYSSLIRYLNKNKKYSEDPIVRIETVAGEAAQVDFGYAGMIFDEESQQLVKAYVFVMVLCYSRDAYYEIVKGQNIKIWCKCHIHAFEHFGGIPKVIIPDNLKSAIIKASFLDPVVNRSYADLARHYGFQIDPCLPGTPEHKGKVESGVKYVKNNFIPLRTFTDFHDANAQLENWNVNIARQRIHGTTRRKPVELFQQFEKNALIPLTTERFEIPVWKDPKVDRDIHIQLDKAYYSVPHELRGEIVLARKTDTQVAIFHENRIVAVHTPVSKGQRSTKLEHYPPDKIRYMQNDRNYCLKKADEIGKNVLVVVRHMLDEEVIRNLRSAQNIIRMQNKYGTTRLENACKRAVFFGNYSYGGIKNILERELDKQGFLFEKADAKPLDSTYARNIKSLLREVLLNGNERTN
jgi:transposase